MPIIENHVEVRVNKSATCDMCGKRTSLNTNRTWYGKKNCVCEECRNFINKLSRKKIIDFVIANEAQLKKIAEPNDVLAKNPYLYNNYTTLIGEYGETNFSGDFIDSLKF